MASVTSACRLSARMVARRAKADSTVRGFRTSARCAAAQNFSMPALSPTMTEGNIATWKIKEGDSFSAGDVLLEIETDKATMDVEAQDDGVLMKIFSGDGSKSVQVGTRIAVMAEAGDDISSMELPADESPKQAKSEGQESKAQKEEVASSSKTDTSAPKRAERSASDGKKHEQKYPLLPSVQHLVHRHGLDADAVASITPTGPQGRLLKGDILAYIGSIDAASPSKNTERFQHLSHLDLSDIKLAKQKEAAPTNEPKPTPSAEDPAAKAAALESESPTEVAVPISLAKVADAQRKIKDTLGVHLPLSTFIARAADVANDDLPVSKKRGPSADELFDQVLGLDKLRPSSTGSRGFYLPQITALPEPSFLEPGFASRKEKKADIIDILAGKKKAPAASAPITLPEAVPGVVATGTNVFSLTVPRGDEDRATVFLERVKVILEQEPGRLVL